MSERIAFITGVSRGIGAALAGVLRDQGFKVYGCATSGEAPAGVTGWACDVSSDAQVAQMFARFAEHESRIDLLVNNAGVLGPRVDLVDVSPEAWRHVFAVNTDGPFFVVRHAAQFLGEGSCIVNVSSSVGRTGRGQWGPYACSKHALEGMTDVLADELRDRGVVVLSMNPGGTATEMRADAFPDEDPETLPTSEEIARVIATEALGSTLERSGAKLNCRDFL